MAEAKKIKKVTKTAKIDTEPVKVETPEEILKAKKQAARAQKAEPEVKEKPIKVKAKKAEITKPKPQPQRSRLERRGKAYRKVAESVDLTKDYELAEALEVLPKTSYAKFDASVEVHVNLGVDPKQADQLVRGTIALPHGSGKSQTVAVFSDDAKVQETAKKAGADLVDMQKIINHIEKASFGFDILVSTPAMMSQLGKFAKALGPKGLMPNPKSGTVTNDIEKTVKELKAGRVEFRVDPSGIIHQVIGKISFKPEQLAENFKALIKAISQAKPASVKSTYIQRISLTTSMGPGLKINLAKALGDL